VIATGDAVPIPPGTLELDFELEVAAVVGRRGADLDPANAADHIVGLMVMNDWSARDLQRREMAVGLGPAKGKDFATTLGPWLVTIDELADHRTDGAFDLTMTATVNGREYSRGCLADLHWSFGDLLAQASRATTIEAGDVIGTGTCGTGCILELSLVHGSDRYPWLQPGDEVTLDVEGIGAITNRVGVKTPR
jgi:2-keto-4-pentenoate hydratase/2-oxohepta-3-ene-1,7-dioic acid hydratase in catechol pathway